MKTNLVISDQNKTLTEQEIHIFESKINAEIPLDYKEFLLQNNGGYPSLDLFPISNNPLDTHVILNRFLCLEEEDMYDINFQISILNDRLPKDLLPIAIDPGGNLFCLGIRDDKYSKVFFCPLDEDEDILIYPLADSFSDLLNGLDNEQY